MEVIIIKVVQFFAALSLLVLIHEFGHFIAARIFAFASKDLMKHGQND